MTSLLGELVQGVIDSVTREILKKPRTTRRARRRSRPAGSKTVTLRDLERLLKPAKRQTSRKRTVRTRAKVKRRR